MDNIKFKLCENIHRSLETNNIEDVNVQYESSKIINYNFATIENFSVKLKNQAIKY